MCRRRAGKAPCALSLGIISKSVIGFMHTAIHSKDDHVTLLTEPFRVLPMFIQVPILKCILHSKYVELYKILDRLCGLVVRVLGYRSGGPGSIPGTTRFSWGGGKEKKTLVGLERGPLSLVSTTEELLNRKVAAPV
jgi:hypothetical protein